MKTYNSGKRRADAVVQAYRQKVYGLSPETRNAQAEAVIAEVNALNWGENPILDAFRYEDLDDPHSTVTEWLFQLARHWTLWQSPRIGTFPLDYRDPSGPLPRGHADFTGEDRVYWDIEDAIRTGGTDDDPTYRDDADDLIVHATRVLMRFDALIPENRRY